jgi:hypothetical protein
MFSLLPAVSKCARGDWRGAAQVPQGRCGEYALCIYEFRTGVRHIDAQLLLLLQLLHLLAKP